jgi:hypothetical protein
MSVVVGEDLCEVCTKPIALGEEVRQVTGAGSEDELGRIRYVWRHVDCESVAHQVLAEVEAPPHAEWVRLLCSDPFEAGRRIFELEQRVAALEGRRR